MSLLQQTTNEYGTGVSQHRCDTCGNLFTVCPAIESEQDVREKGWENCLAVGCDSYDVTRDVDLVWEGIQKFIKRDDDA